MAFLPISGATLQYSDTNNQLATGYFLKFYAAGTTTPINMATDTTGATLLDKCQINSYGVPITGGNVEFTPHLDQNYAMAIYTNATDADNDATGNAVVFEDGFIINPGVESQVLTNSNDPDLLDTDVALITGALDPDAEQHLEYGPRQVQSKSDNTTAAQLELNPLGGNVQVGSATTQSDVLIKGGTAGATRFAGKSSASEIHAGPGGDPSTSATQSADVKIINDSGFEIGSVSYNATINMTVKNDVQGGNIVLVTTDSGGSTANLLTLDPASGVTTGGSVLDAQGFDLKLGVGDQTTHGNSGLSRALVKTSSSGSPVLAINYLGDYTGGALVNGPSLTVGGFDLRLGSDDQTTRGNTGLSRAMTKGTGGVLILNFSNDFASVQVQSDLDVTGALSVGSFSTTSLTATNINTTDIVVSNETTTLFTKYSLAGGPGAPNMYVASNPDSGVYFDGDSVGISSNGSDVLKTDNGQTGFPAGVVIGNSPDKLNYVEQVTQMYTGGVTGAGVGDLPSGWSVLKTATGTYEITHNLGTTNYRVVVTAINNPPIMNCNTDAKNANEFTVIIGDDASPNDVSFDFILVVHP